MQNSYKWCVWVIYGDFESLSLCSSFDSVVVFQYLWLSQVFVPLPNSSGNALNRDLDIISKCLLSLWKQWGGGLCHPLSTLWPRPAGEGQRVVSLHVVLSRWVFCRSARRRHAERHWVQTCRSAAEQTHEGVWGRTRSEPGPVHFRFFNHGRWEAAYVADKKHNQPLLVNKFFCFILKKVTCFSRFFYFDSPQLKEFINQ